MSNDGGITKGFFSVAGILVILIIALILVGLSLDHFEVVDRPSLISNKPFQVDEDWYVCKETDKSKYIRKLKKELWKLEEQ
jgi:hypothetical protein